MNCDAKVNHGKKKDFLPSFRLYLQGCTLPLFLRLRLHGVCNMSI